MSFIDEINGTFKIKLSDGAIPSNTATDVTNSFGEIQGHYTIMQNTLIVTFKIFENYHSINDFNITHIGVFYNNDLIEIIEENTTINSITPYELVWRLKII